MPVPLSATVCGLDESLLAMFSVAVSAPLIDGVNMTAIVHVALLAIAPVHVEVPMVKSTAFVPVIVMFEIVSALPVRFASVTSNGWLAAPSI